MIHDLLPLTMHILLPKITVLEWLNGLYSIPTNQLINSGVVLTDLPLVKKDKQ
jgi:hypothetical protein